MRTMRIRLHALPALVAIVLLASVSLAQRGQRGAAPAPPAPSVPHDPKDLGGVWARQSRVLTMSNETPPMTAWGKSRFDAAKPVYGPRAVPGGLGNDQLRGDAGQDYFVFNTKLSTKDNIDEIEDFSVASDTIKLENGIFTKLVGTGTLSASQFVANDSGTAKDKSDRIIYEKDTGNIYYDSNGSASGERKLFAIVADELKIAADDFFII